MVTLVNSGKTPAKVTRRYFKCNKLADNEEPQFDSDYESGICFLAPGDSGFGFIAIKQSLDPIKREDGNLHSYYWGEVEYEGIDSGSYYTKWAYKADIGDGQTVFYPSDRHNIFT